MCVWTKKRGSINAVGLMATPCPKSLHGKGEKHRSNKANTWTLRVGGQICQGCAPNIYIEFTVRWRCGGDDVRTASRRCQHRP